MNDLISRQAAIDALDCINGVEEVLRSLPSVQPERTEERTETHACDLISRQDAIDAINGLIDRFERILRDIRETNGDDSVCGMCKYDGAYIGQSGDWCNECPGFDKEDCFKLSDECRKRWLKSVELPSAQPEIIHCKDCTKCQIDNVFHDYWCDGRKVWKDHYCGYAERRTDE